MRLVAGGPGDPGQPSSDRTANKRPETAMPETTMPAQWISAYTADERKTLHRCREGERVSADDLLMAVSTAMLLMQEHLNDAYKLEDTGALTGLNRDFWDSMDDLYTDLPDISEHCQRWRAEYTGKPQRKVVVWEPSPGPDFDGWLS